MTINSLEWSSGQVCAGQTYGNIPLPECGGYPHRWNVDEGQMQSPELDPSAFVAWITAAVAWVTSFILARGVLMLVTGLRTRD
ncbi:MAG TPA: hypothetical protein V6D27_10215 [Vampirovibrionales bacterium]